MNTVELKNVMLLVMKKIWSLVNPLCKNMSQVCRITFKQIVPWNNTLTICLKVILQNRAGFYESTFVYSCFCPKIQLFYCLFSSLFLWGTPMVGTKGKIFEIQVSRLLENHSEHSFWRFSLLLSDPFLFFSKCYSFMGGFKEKLARKSHTTFMYFLSIQTKERVKKIGE